MISSCDSEEIPKRLKFTSVDNGGRSRERPDASDLDATQ